MEKIRQRSSNDCGVACLAMLLHVTYDAAQEAFCMAGLDRKRGRKAAFTSNFKELSSAAGQLGRRLAMRRLQSWVSLRDAAIVKVLRRPSGDWHWVVAVRRQNGIEILDPATALPSFERAANDIASVDFTLYKPAGNVLQLV